MNRLLCQNCVSFHDVQKTPEGTYICFNCENTILCIDCGAPFTKNCAAGSVYVPALIERTYQTNVAKTIELKPIGTIKITTIEKVLPRVCEKPTHIEDRQGLRCFDAEGPQFKSAGEIRNHMCVFHENHPGKLHYCFTMNADGVMTWYEWGWA